MSEKKHFIVYKTTNSVNGKIYVGIHETYDVNDGYMGSGNILKRAIEKYGEDKFSREILYDFDNREDMIAMEKNIVDVEFVKRSDTYNLTCGGGSWHHVNSNVGLRKRKNRKAALRMNEIVHNDPSYMARKRKRGSENMKRLHREGKIKPFDWTGRRHNEDSKRMIGKASSVHQKGSENSQYGTCWIYSESEKRSMKIKSDELNQWINKGWKKGRKMKF
jgi:hypothetical protein